MADIFDAPEGRFSIAIPYLDGAVAKNTTLDPEPVWTCLDQEHPNLVTSYTIERGRQYELDRTDTGRATVSIADVDGILDPTNPDGPYYGLIEPLLQAAICRYDPITATWYWRYRGFIEDLTYGFDPSQRVNRLVLSLVDLFEILAAIEMHPGEFGDPSPVAGQVFFEDTDTPVDHNGMQIRFEQIMTDAGIDPVFYVCFSGNIDVHESTFSAGESALGALAEAVDAEHPGASNLFCDRFGRVCAHGRYARWDPDATAATVTPDRWDFHNWKVGDGTAVNSSPSDTAHVRSFAFNRGLSKILNRAMATPIYIADADIAGQLVEDSGSIGNFGIRAWTTQNLITKAGQPGNRTTDLEETYLFAQAIVDNYGVAANRITECVLRSISPSATGAAANWAMLSKCDIGDSVAVHVASPGGGGFVGETFFIEGISEDVKPLNPLYDDVTLSLDLSPRDYFAASPFPPLSAILEAAA